MEADYPHNNAVIGSEGEGEHTHQGEKKSVLTKVKDKARKIKDSIKKHGGHDHEDEDDDDVLEETVNASEFHGAPLHEPDFISGTKLPKQTGLDLGKPAGLSEDPSLSAKVYTPSVGDGREATKTTAVYDDEGTGGVVEGMYDRSLRDEVYGSKKPGVREMLDTDTGNQVRPEGRMPKIPDLQDEHKSSNIRDEVYTGVVDEVTRTSGKGKFDFRTSPDAMDSSDSSVLQPTVKIEPLEGLVKDPHGPKNRPEDIPLSNYETKVVDPTGKGGKEADVSPLVERLGNLHVGDESGTKHTGSHDQFAPQSTPTVTEFNPESDPLPISKSVDPARPDSMPQDTITGKISSATSVITDKAVAAKNAVVSKLGYGEAAGSDYGVTAVDDKMGGDGSDKGVSVKTSSATSVITDKAVAAKNAVASKLGYGEAAGSDYGVKAVDDKMGGDGSDKGASVKTSSATSVITDKAVAAKNAVASKLGYGEAAGSDLVDDDKMGGGGGSDKGVSVKEYWTEKLSPGEEDRALSEAITDAIQKRKGYPSEGTEASSENPPGPGVVGRVKGAVSSWLGMGGATQVVEDQARPELQTGGDVHVGEGAGVRQGGLD